MADSALVTESGLKAMSTIGSWVNGLRVSRPLNTDSNVGRAGATSVELSMTGATSEADTFAELGEEAFKGAGEFKFGDIAASEGSIAAEGVEDVSTLIKVGRFASKALVILAILATIGGLSTSKLKARGRWTNELCAKMFMVYKMKESVETAFSFMSKVYVLLEFEKMDHENKDIPDDKKEPKIQKMIKEVTEEFGVSATNIESRDKEKKNC
ncbi:hypothetical protein F4679DRAFT_577936 [Xylaria curta]|nr:hypothetical protein F4679DRAFT_577936 [Xylaria curta]